MSIRALPLLLLLALSACGGGRDTAPAGLTRDENARLDAAAAAIDINATSGNANATEPTP